jgi:hypothetical protein
MAVPPRAWLKEQKTAELDSTRFSFFQSFGEIVEGSSALERDAG